MSRLVLISKAMIVKRRLMQINCLKYLSIKKLKHQSLCRSTQEQIYFGYISIELEIYFGDISLIFKIEFTKLSHELKLNYNEKCTN